MPSKPKKRIKHDMTNGPIGPLLIRMTLPMIFGILGLTVFNLVDTYFVAQLGTDQLAALSFTFPVVLVLNSLALGIGVGATTLVSRSVGQGNRRLVMLYNTGSLILGVLLVVSVVSIGLLTINPLFRLLGAGESTLPYIHQYMRIWYLGVAFVVIPMIGNSTIRGLGDTFTPSIVMTVAALTNTVLDPIFIFGFGPIPAMGVTGAALATVIARMTTFSVAMYILIKREKVVGFDGASPRELLHAWREILYIGIPNAITRMMLPIGVAVMTGLVAKYGVESVAGYGVSTRVERFVMMIPMALSTVIMPFIGQNSGAKKYERLEEGIRKSERAMFAYGLLMLLLMAFGGRSVGSLFTDNQTVLDTVQLFFWIVPVNYCFQGVFLMHTSILNALNKPIWSSGLTLVRIFGVNIPVAVLLGKWFGVAGVWMGITVSFIIGMVLSSLAVRKRLKQVEALQ